MADVIDGSVLEEESSPSPPIEEPQKQDGDTPVAEEVKPSEPQPTIPEEYKDYSNEDLYKMYRDTKAEEGRRKKEAEGYIQENYLLRNQIQGSASNQSTFDVNQSPHLPVQPGAQGLENGESKIDLNKLLDEDPGAALQEAARIGSETTLANYQKRQEAKVLSDQQRRRDFMTNEVLSEVRRIRNEDPRLNDYVWGQMQRIDAEDEMSSALENDPSLTPQKIQKQVRALFKKATEGIMTDKEASLRLMGYDEATIKQLKAIEKEAASSGAPLQRAGNPPPTANPADSMSEVERRYNFLPNIREKYGLDD